MRPTPDLAQPLLKDAAQFPALVGGRAGTDRHRRQRAYARTLARHALRSLYAELTLYPKPGLVSRVDNGSHEDMSAATFLRSLFSLRHYFFRICLAGISDAPFSRLRQLGMEAEARMMIATTRNITSVRRCTTPTTGSAFTPIVATAMPTSTARTSTCSASQLTNGENTLSGMIPNRNSTVVFGLLVYAAAASAVAPAVATPAPGLNAFATTSPITSAIVVTTSK